MRPPLWRPLAFLIGFSLLLRWLALDQLLQQPFWSEQGGWWLAKHGAVRFLYHYSTWPALFVGIGSGLVWFASWVTGRYKEARPITLFLSLLLVVGPGIVVNFLLKNHVGRPRPVQTLEFGGNNHFRRLGELGSKAGKSFPSGHASMGFYWLGLSVFFWERRRNRAWVFAVLGLTLGTVIGVGRMAQGGHWPSDILWSAGVIYFAAWVLHYALFRTAQPSAPRDEPVGIFSLGRAAGDPIEAFSVVVPFYNEAGNVRFVLEELRTSLPDAEIIAVDDGSTDETWAEILRTDGVRGLRMPRNLGQSAAIYHGLQACTGDVCGLMDGDGQNDPDNFHLLLDNFRRSGARMVCGYRAKRHDSWNRKAASRAANMIRRLFLKDGVRDTGCSQKVFRREDVALLVPFRGLHRYLPAFFRQAGLQISEVPVKHRDRRCGVSKYTNWSRAMAGIHDLIGVSWLLSRKLPVIQLESKL